jgi:sulfoxide reductase heme-binding subunit YedZ
VASITNKSAIRNPQSAILWFLKPVVFLAALGPVTWLVWAALTNNLSANPLSDLTNETGTWTLRFLCITLAVTPLRRLTGWNVVIRFRRMTGLFAFFYGTLHFLTYAIVDRYAGLDLTNGYFNASVVRELVKSVGEDIYKRPFITVGFTAFSLMVPLALTSTSGMIRRLGGKRWNRLHRLVYVSAAAGVVHYWWLVKADVRRPLAYGVVVATLLLFRVWWSRAHATVTWKKAPDPVRRSV